MFSFAHGSGVLVMVEAAMAAGEAGVAVFPQADKRIARASVMPMSR
jgi:hypothetical protein